MRILMMAAALLAATSCGKPKTTVTIKGSDTMVLLGQRWAELYMHSKPGVTVQVTGGGSGTGIAALIDGSTNICQASRPMKDKEKADAKKKQNKDPKEIPVAMDGLSIYVHPSNRLDSITMDQLEGIYTGKITNWKDLGGDDATIVVYGRENNSGTYVFFKEHILNNKDFAPGVQTLSGTGTIVNTVSTDPKSIGYGGIAYGTGVIKSLKVRKTAEADAIMPSLETVQNGTYPLARELYFYTLGEPTGAVKEFIDWVLSDEGQKVCDQVGYYPLRKK